jgi:hypothetical protein
VDRIDLGQDRDQWRVTFGTVNFFTRRATMSFSRILLPGDGNNRPGYSHLHTRLRDPET